MEIYVYKLFYVDIINSLCLHNLFYTIQNGKAATIPILLWYLFWVFSHNKCTCALKHHRIFSPNTTSTFPIFGSNASRGIGFPALEFSMRHFLIVARFLLSNGGKLVSREIYPGGNLSLVDSNLNRFKEKVIISKF